MLDINQARELFKTVEKHATTSDVEMLIGGGRSALTRFANNEILQNVSDDNYEISVRVQFGGKTARASTNKWDSDSLRQAVQAAEALAKVQEDDPDLPPMYSGSAGQLKASPCRQFDETRAMGPDERADAVGQIVKVARDQSLNSAGVYAVSDHVEGVFNSHGVARWHAQTSAEVSITMMGADSSGWQKANSPDARKIDHFELANICAAKAKLSVAPREIPAGKYKVILEPAAVLDLVGAMFWDFGGLALLDQRSFLTNRIGTRLFGPNITIYDDVKHPLQSGADFDGEGVPRQRVELVREGMVSNIVYSRASAERIAVSDLAGQLRGSAPTGHGFPLPNEMGEAPMNIVFELPSDVEAKTVDQMVAETDRGILVTRVWYIREVDPYEKILTGMTRDGTFLVENGRVVSGIRNFRFNEGLIHLLSNVDGMSEAVRASGEEAFDMVVPAMRVRDFNFTEVTRF